RGDHTRWNASQAALGAALTFKTPGGVLQDTRPDGTAAWLSAGVPLGSAVQLLGSLRYTYRGDGESHVGGLGTRLTVYQGRFVAMLDAGAGAQRQAGDWTGRALLGLTAQVLLWGSTWGEVSGLEDLVLRSGADQKLTVTANLKWSHDIVQGLR